MTKFCLIVFLSVGLIASSKDVWILIYKDGIETVSIGFRTKADCIRKKKQFEKYDIKATCQKETK